MFHELLTFHDSFEQFSDFNGVFRGFLSKKMFSAQKNVYLCDKYKQRKLCRERTKECGMRFIRRQ